MWKKEMLKTVFSLPYWQPAYQSYFDKEFTLEMPYAPPGMPQNLSHGQTIAHFLWLEKSVKAWRIADMEIYGVRDNPALYWIIRNGWGDVHWAGVDGTFESRIVCRVTLKDGKILHIKEFSDPFAYLRAIGTDIPVFKMGLDQEAAQKRRAENPSKAYQPDPDGDKPQVIRRKIEDNIAAFTAGQFHRQVNGPTVEHFAWFVPRDMKNHYAPEETPAMDLWMERSLLEWTTHCDPVIYETDQEGIYFFECGGYGYTDWQGNHAPGGYQNRYLKFLVTNQGEVVRNDEYLNPIYKLNSIGARIPSFPYMF